MKIPKKREFIQPKPTYYLNCRKINFKDRSELDKVFSSERLLLFEEDMLTLFSVLENEEKYPEKKVRYVHLAQDPENRLFDGFSGRELLDKLFHPFFQDVKITVRELSKDAVPKHDDKPTFVASELLCIEGFQPFPELTNKFCTFLVDNNQWLYRANPEMEYDDQLILNYNFIYDSAFENCKFKNLTLPKIESIEPFTFGSSELEYIVAPKVTKIENNAFYCCENLKMAKFDSVEEINVCAFAHTGLKELFLPGIQKIADDLGGIKVYTENDVRDFHFGKNPKLNVVKPTVDEIIKNAASVTEANDTIKTYQEYIR